jgi:outer membrane protein assembly factor BamD (BamD/ComL family)
MNTRKSFIYHLLLLLIATAILIKEQSLQCKTNPGVMSPSQVAALQKERESAPIDKIELAKAQEKFKPFKKTKEGAIKKQRVPRKTLRYMTYEETKEAKNKLLASKDHFAALKYQERMLKLCDDLNELEALFLEYADTHRVCKHPDKAAALYTEFVNSYPGSHHTEYALYQAIECSSQLILGADRDQTNTRKTIELTDQFLEKADLFAQYKDKVEDIRTRCRKLLVASEYNVYTFYFNNGDYAQAQRRLEGVRNDWLELVPSIEYQLIAYESELAHKQHNMELAQSKEAELALKFPDISRESIMNKPAISFVNKF